MAFAVITGTAGNDTLVGSAIANAGQLILGLAGNDTLTAGTGGNTVLDGGDGNDTLRDAGAAATATLVDTMSGGAVDDTYVVTRASDVIEQPNAGTDTVRTNLRNVCYPLTWRTSYGSAGLPATGSANNTFSGFDGTSILTGGGGTDTALFSGQFAQYHVVANPDGSVTLTDTRAGTPNGTATFIDFDLFQFSDGLVLTEPQLGGSTGTQPTAVNGTTGNDTLTSAVAGAIISGLGGSDTLTAGAANQTLDGGAGADILNDGGQSGITLLGGAGNDTFIVSNPVPSSRKPRTTALIPCKLRCRAISCRPMSRGLSTPAREVSPRRQPRPAKRPAARAPIR